MSKLIIKICIITMILIFGIPIPSQNTNPSDHIIGFDSIPDGMQSSINLDHSINAATSSIALQEITTSSFVSKWDTTKIGVSTNLQIKLPLQSTGSYNFTVDWGDGYNDTITSYNQVEVTHTYSSGGTYTVVIDGRLIGWQFYDDGDKLKIIEISQWGDINLGNSGSYFYGCKNLVLTATDALDLTGTTSLYQAFPDCYSLGSTGSMDSWDVSGVTNMESMFAQSSFNGPIGNWDVSSVTDMSYMLGQSSFNQPIDNWDVSSVTDMQMMFLDATSFNQSINNWDVSSVTDMDEMFSGASSFNQPIGNWDVSSVTEMGSMFLEVTLSSQNYDDLLIGWASLTLQFDVIFHGGNSKYTNLATVARQHIIDTFRWFIHDGGSTESSPTTESPLITSILIVSLGIVTLIVRRKRK